MSEEEPGGGTSTAPVQRGHGPLFVLTSAAVGVALTGFAAFAVQVALHPTQPVVETMCLDSSCTYGRSADLMPMSAATTPAATPRATPIPAHGRLDWFGVLLRLCGAH